MSDSFDDNATRQDSDGGTDNVTETTTEGWGSRLGGSLIAAVIGLIMVPAAIVLLYWNEGRAVDAIRALNRGAAMVIEAGADAADPKTEGKLVHVSGMMRPAAPARDPVFGVTADGLLRLSRKVEMYQWEEQSSSQSQQNVGGSKTTETTYTYKRAWSEQPINSSHFKIPANHQNPSMPGRSTIFAGGGVTLGAYKVDEPVLNRLSRFTPLTASAPPPARFQRSGDGYYRGQDPSQPAIGDVRVTFSGVTAQTTSVVAAQSGGVLTTWRDSNGYTIALADPGAVSAATMFNEEKAAESVLTWVLRGVGFVLVLIGFVCMTRPLTMLFAVLPFLESIVGAGVFLAALTVSVPVTLVTIAVAWIAHRPLVGALLLAAACGALFALGKIGPRRRAPARA